MKIAIVGGAGNIGHHLTAHLAPQHTITCVDLNPVHVQGARSVILNVLEPDGLTDALSGNDLAINMANWPGVFAAGEQRVLSENTVMTYNVLDAVVKAAVPRLIHCSSESAMGFGHKLRGYEPVPRYLPIDEEHPNLPAEAYSYSKLFGEILCEGFHRSHGLKIIVLRYSWVLTDRGLEIFKETVYPHIKDGTILDKTENRFGAYTSVQDFCAGMDCVITHEEIDYDTFLLVGPTTFFPRPTLEIAREYYGSDIKVRRPEYYEREPMAPFFDYGKASHILGYAPRHSWQDLI